MTWHLRHRVHGNQPWAVQAEAQRRAAGADRYGWFLEQGLGKTALALNEYINLDHVDLNIVLSPQSFKLDWVLAPEEWGLGFLRSGYWPRNPLPVDWDMGVYAINYESASRSSIVYDLQRLLEQRRCMLTVDESTNIGNPGTGFTSKAIELAKRAKVVRLLNGTPYTNNVMNYYGQLRALGQFNGWLPTTFRNKYAVRGGYMGKKIVGVQNEEELAGVIESCSFRALKKDWRKDLPPQLPAVVHLEMTDRQWQHYRTMMEEFYAELDNGQIVTAEMVVSKLLKLQQIAGGFILDGNQVHRFEEIAKLPKLKAAVEVASQEHGKTIVPFYYRESGRMLLDAMTKARLQPARILSQQEMKPEEIIKEKQRFNEDPDCRVMVGQERAMALGHTLIGSGGDHGRNRCTRTFFYESSFALYYRLQLQDRNHRGEQDETCTLIDCVAAPIDQIVIDNHAGKREIADFIDEIVATVRSKKW